MKLGKWLAILITALIIIWCTRCAIANDIVVVWNSNDESDLAGYKIYYGGESGNYDGALSPIDVGNQTSWTIPDLVLGELIYVALTAYDTSGNESDKSVEVSTIIQDITPPNIPDGISIQQIIIVTP